MRSSDGAAAVHPSDSAAPGWRWLIVDLERPEDATRVEIRIDDRLVKACGSGMWTFRPGAPLTWRVYAQFIRNGHAGSAPATWLAYPLPRDLDPQPQAISVRACEGTVGVRADFARLDDLYPGPLFEPWGTSLYRWLWSGDDPRYPVPRALAERYSSRIGEGADERHLGDRGLLRVLMATLPFGPVSNVATPPDYDSDLVPACPRGYPAGHLRSPELLVCRGGRGQLLFFGPGSRLIGFADPSFSQVDPLTPALVSRVRGAGYSVELVQVLAGLAFAHFHDEGGQFLGSVAFATIEP